jgi:D-sedoheptulose 7-phosphate isomerase
MCARSLGSGGKILICGNGGSAADAQHLAAELVGRYRRERAPWPVIALNTNSSILTAIGNDYGYDEVFMRQVEAHGREGDVLVAISTSGKSPSVLRAVDAASRLGIATIFMTGQSGREYASQADIVLGVPSNETPRIQESHILLGHVLCGLVEDALCEKL